jgi:hypothetical protein
MLWGFMVELDRGFFAAKLTGHTDDPLPTNLFGDLDRLFGTGLRRAAHGAS